MTGITGTIGHGLLPFLEGDRRIAKVIGLGSRPWDPDEAGLTKVDFRQVDVREGRGLRRELGWQPEFSSREALASTRRALAI